MNGLHLELYCGETDSAQYEIRISQRYFNRNRKYVNPLLSVPGRLELWILTGGKTCWTVPFLNKIRKEPIHMPPRSMIQYCGETDSVVSTVWYPEKIRITLLNLNKIRKYFNPLVSGPGRIGWWKNEGRKSRWTVPLRAKYTVPAFSYLYVGWKLFLLLFCADVIVYKHSVNTWYSYSSLPNMFLFWEDKQDTIFVWLEVWILSVVLFNINTKSTWCVW